MKKDGIQTRNRKLSSKSKKKKGFTGFEGMMRPLDKAGFGFPGSNFGAGMSPYMAYQNNMQSMGAPGFVSPQMGMGGMSALGMGNLAISSAAAPSAMVSRTSEVRAQNSAAFSSGSAPEIGKLESQSGIV